MAKAGGRGAYWLVLFDFSLSRTPPENIEAGTRPYLDPFRANRGAPPRWDLYAERYAAAVTLHEMMAGVPPVFGDGETDPLVIDHEATIAAERFDPALRDGLTAFLGRALRRDPAERFGNAEEVLRAWRQAFEPMERAAIAEDSIERIAPRLDRRSSIAEVGYGVEARGPRSWASTPSSSCWPWTVSAFAISVVSATGSGRDTRARQTSRATALGPRTGKHRRGQARLGEHRPSGRAVAA